MGDCLVPRPPLVFLFFWGERGFSPKEVALPKQLNILGTVFFVWQRRGEGCQSEAGQGQKKGRQLTYWQLERDQNQAWF
jgi:hypothetical protein